MDPTTPIPEKTNAKIRRTLIPVDSPELQKMREQRRSLPAHYSRSDILPAICRSQVPVVSGATGSGETSQVPQLILEDATGRGETISIICTEPRRVAAMSIAVRVSDERCEPTGKSVGYRVKMSIEKSSNKCLLFCTTGVLHRHIQGNLLLRGLTHIIVDEVHELFVETDFLLLNDLISNLFLDLPHWTPKRFPLT